MTEQFIFTPLLDCRKLTTLSLEGNFSSFLNDAFLRRLAAKNALSRLRIFDVAGADVPLSLESARLLAALPRIAELRLSNFALMSAAERAQFERFVRASGWKLHLRLRRSGQQT